MITGRPTTYPNGESVRVLVNAEKRKMMDEIAERTGDNISEIIRKAIKAYIDQF